MTVIPIPELALVLLVGPAGCGKTTFAREHFQPTEIVSSDACRALVSDSEDDQSATAAAFEILHLIVEKRLEAGRLTVVDATNVLPQSRRPLIALARQHYCDAVAIVFDLPEQLCERRSGQRSGRPVGAEVVREQFEQMRRTLSGIKREGFHDVFTLTSPEAVDAATIQRIPLPPNRKDEHGPFDIIGDIHGCFDELHTLLSQLGYQIEVQTDRRGERRYDLRHPEGRKVVFLGDLVDRGPKIMDVLRLVMDSVEAGVALCVPGNHDIKLLRYLLGHPVRVAHGLAETLDQLAREPLSFAYRVEEFLAGEASHLVLDGGRLVVAHAGMKAEMMGREARRIRDFALYGETTGEVDEYGLPVRLNWALDYQGRAMIVYGHTPVAGPVWLNNTINIDTGCVFGGALTALRYPEKEIISVPAARIYAQSAKPFPPSSGGVPEFTMHSHDDC